MQGCIYQDYSRLNKKEGTFDSSGFLQYHTVGKKKILIGIFQKKKKTEIIIIMKNFNRRSSHGEHGSNAANWCNTHTHMDRLFVCLLKAYSPNNRTSGLHAFTHAFSRIYIKHSYNHSV